MLRCYLKQALHKTFSLVADVFVSKKKRHVHITFTIPISQYQSFDRLIDFISKEREQRKIFSYDYKMLYPRLLSSLKWTFDYLFFEEKKKKKWKIKCQKSYETKKLMSYTKPLQKTLLRKNLAIQKGTHLPNRSEEERQAAWRGEKTPTQNNI